MNKTYCLIQFIRVWNGVREGALYFFYRFSHFYAYLVAYLANTHRQWIFIPGHSLPLTRSSIQNEVGYLWSYSSSENALTYKECTTPYSFSWLSAKLVIRSHEHIEYSLDEFIQTFRLATKPARMPTLTMLFMAWCAYTQQWYATDSSVEFHIIDDGGNEQVLVLPQDNHRLTVIGDKICSTKL